MNLFGHVPFQLLDKYLPLITKNQINPEIYFRADVLDEIDMHNVEHLNKVFTENNIQTTFHGPFLDLNPGANDEAVRHLTLERYFKVINIAKILNPASIVFHTGYNPLVHKDFFSEWYENNIKTWLEVLNHANGLDTKLLIENVFETNPDTFRKILDEVNSPQLGVCFDIGHFSIFTERPIDHWFSSLNQKIFEIHIHDNNNKTDYHLPLGRGIINFDYFFKILDEYNCTPNIVIESHKKSDYFESVEYLRKKGFYNKELSKNRQFSPSKEHNYKAT